MISTTNATTQLLRTLLLRDTHRVSSSSGGLGVLTTHAQVPEMSQTTMHTNLLQALQIFTQFVVQTVRQNLRILSILDVLLTIEEPVRNLVGTRVLDDGHDALELLGGKLTGTLVAINVSLLADNIGITTTNTLDRGQRKDDFVLSVNVRVEQTQNVLEI